MGASPDGLVGDDGLVEVKCLPSIGDMTLDEAIAIKKKNPLEKAGDLFRLKTSHPYFYQIMGQLHITGRTFCDLIIYAENAYFVQRIFPDDTMWSEMLPKLTRFYLDCMLPEITDPRIPRGLKVREPPSLQVAVKAREAAMAATVAKRVERAASRTSNKKCHP